MNEGWMIIARPEHWDFWLRYAEVVREEFWALPWEFKLWDGGLNA